MADTFNSVLSDVDDSIIDALGETVTVKNASDVSVGSVVGVFDEQYIETVDIQGLQPTFVYKASDLTIETSYEITRNSTAYNVRIKQPDGTGMVTLVLGEKG